MEDIKYWVWLSRIEKLRYKTFIKLLAQYKTLENLWNLDRTELVRLGLAQDLADDMTNLNYKTNLDKYIEYMQKNGIEIINIFDGDYPKKLKQIYDPPISIYIKGNKKILNDKMIAIIGCRECTTYGANVAKKFAYNLSLNNINIVSGGARGIDTCSHIGAMIAKGKTMAVIGSGIDVIYPPENKKIFQEIIQTGGTIISEYIVGAKPIKQHFPARNRIISGISDGIVVVEAKEKSGTLITVDFALEQGREVFVIPGNINNLNSYGTNELIKEGAKLVTKPEEIINNLI